jgi:hypothetical protein
MWLQVYLESPQLCCSEVEAVGGVAAGTGPYNREEAAERQPMEGRVAADPCNHSYTAEEEYDLYLARAYLDLTFSSSASTRKY